MTAQVGDVLRHQDREYAMRALPLEDYLDQTGLPRPFKPAMTCFQRGYMAEWRLSGDRLLLVSIIGDLLDGRPATLANLFPQAWTEWVFADWYSGIIDASYGRTERVHPLMPPVHESTWNIQFRNGRVVSQWQARRDPGSVAT